MLGVVIAAALASDLGSQVHVALGHTQDSLNVAWVTETGNGTTTVTWGTSCSNLTSSAKGDARAFTQDVGRLWYSRTAVMSGLSPNKEYCYKVGVDGVYPTQTYTIVNRRALVPDRHIIFGDMGSAASFSLCQACKQYDEVCTAETCAQSLQAGLVSEVDTASLFYHAGDFGYNLADNNGMTGHNYMKNVEQFAARVPYMVNHGNHEDYNGNLEHYVERFRNMPSNADPATIVTANGEATNSLYFSFDSGLVHYISISTELWVGVGTDKVSNKTLLAWLERDLVAANSNRHNVPWIIISGHRALYTSEPSSGSQYPEDIPIKTDLEPLLFKYGVDFCVNGHIHNYERSWPTYKGKSTQSYVDPTATVYIVTGAAGSREMSSAFQQPSPSWSAFRSNSFSYSRMLVYNATHIHWQQVLTDPVHFEGKYGDILDDVWFVQHNHGPFDESRAPKDVPQTHCVTHDHFTPQMLGIDDGSGRDTYLQIMDYKKKHGAAAFAKKLQAVLAKINDGGNALMWEEESLARDTRNHFKWANGGDQ
eukprot:TRINITY_DN15726_c0_g1_i1.p1 TRINITY_DN15726_c0_g1~~TRINITY_DN15726_c0_g1_i1.p1  ORF type:complete len:536 (+),score=185.13 TRINITY_DN15726_c0_g1_i1:42-1649(+)